MSFAERESRQDAKYDIPYHYAYTDRDVAGILYFSYLRRAADLLLECHPRSVLDVGCGDGRFLAFLREQGFTGRLDGVDHSPQAVAFARLYNPSSEVFCKSVEQVSRRGETYDVLTLIDVLEHIPPAQLPGALTACRDSLDREGSLVITVPTLQERKVSKAHYQHFTREGLEGLLAAAGLRIRSIEGNFRQSRMQTVAQGCVENSLFRITHPALVSLYRRAFFRFWARCPVELARRFIVVAEKLPQGDEPPGTR